nr:MAG: hypothetical protein [Microviridae sp.]
MDTTLLYLANQIGQNEVQSITGIILGLIGLIIHLLRKKQI